MWRYGKWECCQNFLNAMTINGSNVDWREQRRERGGGQVEEGSGREHRHRQVGQVEILDECRRRGCTLQGVSQKHLFWKFILHKLDSWS